MPEPLRVSGVVRGLDSFHRTCGVNFTTSSYVVLLLAPGPITLLLPVKCKKEVQTNLDGDFQLCKLFGRRIVSRMGDVFADVLHEVRFAHLLVVEYVQQWRFSSVKGFSVEELYGMFVVNRIS